MIRPAEDRDIDCVVMLCREFYETHPMHTVGGFDPVYNRGLVQGFIHSSEGCVYVAERDDIVVGLAAMVVMPTLFHPTIRMAHEVIWYLTPTARYGTLGARLLFTLEAWARLQGVQGVVMVGVGDAITVARIYERWGYSWWESSYGKFL